jgi:uncharacterized protein YkwD
VDPFVLIMAVGVVVLLVAVILLGLFYPGTGAEQLGWKPTRSMEVEVRNEVDDMEQMLAATNERRRRRGAAELTEEGLRAEVAADLRERLARRDAELAEQEVEQMLAAKNERRARKGLEPLTADEYRASLEG